MYAVVTASGLGSLQCLGCEVFGRWSRQCVELVPALARERARGMHPRIRRGTALSLQHRWWGVLGVALQKAVAHLVLNQTSGADLIHTQLEPIPPLAEVVFSLDWTWHVWRCLRVLEMLEGVSMLENTTAMSGVLRKKKVN